MKKQKGQQASSGPKELSRRSFLQRVGKYSAIAALALSQAPLTILGCGGGGSGGGGGGNNTPSPSLGSTPDTAGTFNLGDEMTATLSQTDPVAYAEFTTSEYIDVFNISLMSVSGTGTCTVLDSGLNPVGDVHNCDSAHDITMSLDVGTYYIRFESSGGDCEISAKLVSEDFYAWNNTYSDTTSWSNYSDSYSDWSNYSDAYSDAYSDSYSDWSNVWAQYSDYWSNAWGNWMQSW